MKKIAVTYFELLCKTNYRAINLSLLRVCLCIWLLAGLCSDWFNAEFLYSKQAISLANQHTLASIHYQYYLFMLVYGVVIILQMLGIGRHTTAFLLYLLYYYHYHLDIAVVNGGDNICRYVLLFMTFANSYHHLTIYKYEPLADKDALLQNLLSNLAAFSIMIEICLLYCSSAIGKLQTADWCNGEAVYYAFASERYGAVFVLKDYIKLGWLVKAATWSALALELCFPILIWIKKYRPFILFAGLLLHVSICVTMKLYSFQVVMILLYIIFLEEATIKKWLNAVGLKYSSAIRVS